MSPLSEIANALEAMPLRSATIIPGPRVEADALLLEAVRAMRGSIQMASNVALVERIIAAYESVAGVH